MRLTLLFLTSFFALPYLSQACEIDHCGSIPPTERIAYYAQWPAVDLPCIGDRQGNILDLACMINFASGQRAPILSLPDSLTAPVARNLVYTIQAIDPDGQSLTFSSPDLPAGATLSSEGLLDFTPSTMQVGLITLTIKASNGPLSTSDTLQIKVKNVLNAIDVAFNLDEDQRLPVYLGFEETYNEPLQFEILQAPSLGTLTGVPPQLYYTPAPNATGNDRIVFRAESQHFWSTSAEISLTINPSNDPPKAHDQVVIIDDNGDWPITLTGSDDESDPLTFQILTQPQYGTLSGSSPHFTYTPGTHFKGSDAFTFQASDGLALSDSARVELIAADDTPVLAPHPDRTKQANFLLEGYAKRGNQVEITTPLGVYTTPVTAGQFAIQLPLAENQLNMLYVIAIDGSFRSAPRSTQIIHDNIPPVIHLLTPNESEPLVAGTIACYGTVSDPLSGFDQLQVTVNGVPATLESARDFTGTFFAEVVAFNLNHYNLIEIIATDALGNTTRAQHSILQRLPTNPDPFLRLVSGTDQQGQPHQTLNEPIVVRLIGSEGQPIPNKAVLFEVELGSGGIHATQQDQPVASLSLVADQFGEARVYWTLGAAHHQSLAMLKVSSQDLIGPSRVFARITAPANAPQIHLLSGDLQRLETGAPITRPLVAWVNNGTQGIADVPVTFSVQNNDGHFFGGTSEITVTSDAYGYARVIDFHLGNSPGNNTIAADFDGNTAQPALFQLFGSPRNSQASTSLTGVVHDVFNQPIIAATVRLSIAGLVAATTQTDATGTFTLDQIADGPASLEIDASNLITHVGQPIPRGTFTRQRQNVLLVPGHANRIAGPIRFQALESDDIFYFDNSDDLDISPAKIPGMSLHIAAGSMRNLDGSVRSFHQGPVELHLQAHHRNNGTLPVVHGSSASIAWSFRADDVTFDPPIRISMPNTQGLSARSAFPMLQYHDQQQAYLPTGVAQVSKDQTRLISGPGAGLSGSSIGIFASPIFPAAAVVGAPCSSGKQGLANANNKASRRTLCDPQNPFVLDDSWTLSVAGHHVQVNADGSFRIANLNINDNFGNTAGNRTPDQLSDGFYRLEGFRQNGNTTEWLYSDRLQLIPGDIFNLDQVTFNTTPREIPQELTLLGPLRLDQSTTRPFELKVTLANGTQQEVTSRSQGTSFYSSNPAIASVDASGQISGHQVGTTVITAVFEDQLVSQQVRVTATSPPTVTLSGFLFLDGTPLANAHVLTINDQSFQTDQVGFFSFEFIVDNTALTLDTYPRDSDILLVPFNVTLDGQHFHAHVHKQIPDDQGPADLGLIHLQPGFDGDGDGLTIYWENIFGYNDSYIFTDRDDISDDLEDYDNDQMPNLWEIEHGLDPTWKQDALLDNDRDGLDNRAEALARSNPLLPDSDGDGMGDAYEVNYGLDPLDARDALLDNDGDGITNLREFHQKTDPFRADQTAPELLDMFPADGSSQHPLNYGLIFSFDEAIQIQDVANHIRVWIDDRLVAGNFEYTQSSRHLYFQPSSDWPSQTLIRVNIEHLRDRAGNPIAGPITKTFTTADNVITDAPSISQVLPNVDLPKIPLNQQFIFNFDQPMIPDYNRLHALQLSKEFDNNPVSGTLTYSQDLQTLTFVPERELEPGKTYTMTFHSDDFKTLSGQQLSPQEFTYNTSAQAYQNSPSLRYTAPLEGTTNLPINANIWLVFDRPMDRDTLMAHFSIVDEQQNVLPLRFEFHDNDQKVRIRPDNVFNRNTTYTLQVAPGVTDALGNPLGSSHQWTLHFGEELIDGMANAGYGSPSNQSTDLARNVLIRYRSRLPLIADSITSESFKITLGYYTDVPGTFSLSDDGRMITLTPLEPLTAHSDYRVVTSGLINTYGVQIDPRNWQFSTGDDFDHQAPSVLLTNPPQGTLETPHHLDIRLLLSEQFVKTQPLSDFIEIVDATGMPIPDADMAITTSGTSIKVNDLSLEPSTQYTLTLSNLRDLAGNVMSPYTLQFTTAAQDVTGRTQIISTSPADDDSDIDPNSPIVVTFDRTLDPFSSSSASFLVRDSALREISGELSISGSTVTFTPLFEDLSRAPEPQSDVHVYIANFKGIASEGNHNYSFTFRTGGDADTVSPRVVAMEPSDGSTLAKLDQRIRLTFSEEVDFSTFYDNVNISINGEVITDVIPHYEEHPVPVLTIGPGSQGWPPSSSLEITLSSQITDYSFNPLIPFLGQLFTPSGDRELCYVTETQPENRSLNEPRKRSILIHFSEPMDLSSLSEALSVKRGSEEVRGSIQLIGNQDVLVFTVPGGFETGSYSVTLSNAGRSLSGKSLRTHTFDFSTYTTRWAGYGVKDTNFRDPIPTNGHLRIRFDYPVDLNSLDTARIELINEDDNQSLPIQVHFEYQNRQMRIVPEEPLTTSRLRIITRDLYDIQGYELYVYTDYFLLDPFDDEPIVLAQVSPRPESHQLALNSRIGLVFSKAISRLSVHPENLGVTINGNLYHDWDALFKNRNKNMFIHFNEPLPPFADISITANNLEDEAGHPVEPFTLHFTVGDQVDMQRPTLSTSSIQRNQANVPINPQLVFYFDEPLNAADIFNAKIFYNISNDLDSLTQSSLSHDGKRLTLWPGRPLDPDRTYFLGLSDVTDHTGNNPFLARIPFSTTSVPDEQPPQLISIAPNNVDPAPRNTQIFLIFNEPIKALGDQEISLVGNGPVPFRTVLEGNYLSIVPLSYLAANTTFNLTITDIQDLSGNTMASPISTSFSTSNNYELTHLIRLFPDPIYNSSPFPEPPPYRDPLPLNPTLRLAFNTPVDPTGLYNSMRLRQLQEGTDTDLAITWTTEDQGRTLLVTPSEQLQPNQQFALHLDHVTSLGGITASFDPIVFTTAGESDHAPPTIIARSIDLDQTGLSLSPQLNITFDEPILPIGLTEGSLAMRRADQKRVPLDYFIYSEDPSVLIIDVQGILESNTTYEVLVTDLPDFADNRFSGTLLRFTTR